MVDKNKFRDEVAADAADNSPKDQAENYRDFLRYMLNDDFDLKLQHEEEKPEEELEDDSIRPGM